jgi:hypothetical protein
MRLPYSHNPHWLPRMGIGAYTGGSLIPLEIIGVNPTTIGRTHSKDSIQEEK